MRFLVTMTLAAWDLAVYTLVFYPNFFAKYLGELGDDGVRKLDWPLGLFFVTVAAVVIPLSFHYFPNVALWIFAGLIVPVVLHGFLKACHEFEEEQRKIDSWGQ